MTVTDIDVLMRLEIRVWLFSIFMRAVKIVTAMPFVPYLLPCVQNNNAMAILAKYAYNLNLISCIWQKRTAVWTGKLLPRFLGKGLFCVDKSQAL